jgi:hypothetical protein
MEGVQREECRMQLEPAPNRPAGPFLRLLTPAGDGPRFYRLQIERAVVATLSSCLPDSCLPDSCLPDSCLPDSCLPDSCLPDSCLPGILQPLLLLDFLLVAAFEQRKRLAHNLPG